jgi:DNA-binding NtrC family response regulator
MSQMLEMKPRVVVVEDDAENRRALSELLAAEGFESFPYTCGEEAWSAIASEQVRPDVVVADVRMPGLDGMALLRQIKSRFPGLPVILVSAFADERAWVEGLQAGALDVFPKPIRGGSLVRALREAAGVAPE